MTSISGFGFSTREGARDMSLLDEDLAGIAASGAQFAEISAYDYDLIVGGRLLRERVNRLKAICRRHELSYTVHGALAVNFMDAANLALHKRTCRAMLELCHEIEAAVMVHHSGFARNQPQPALNALHALECETLLEMAELAKGYGVRIAVENLFAFEPDRYTAQPFKLAELLGQLDHATICATLDVSHCYLACNDHGLDFVEALHALAPFTGHLHIHDSFGLAHDFHGYTPSEDNAFGIGDLHLPIGWGDIAWDTILPGLPVRDGTVFMVELPAHWWSELAPCAQEADRLVALMNAPR